MKKPASSSQWTVTRGIVSRFGLLSASVRGALAVYLVLTPLHAAADACSLLLLLAAFTTQGDALPYGRWLGPLLDLLGASRGAGSLLLLALGLFSFKAVVTVVLAALEAWLQAQFRRGIQEKGFECILRGRWESISHHQVGRWTGALTEEAAIISKYLQCIVHAVHGVFTFCVLAGLAFLIAPLMSVTVAAIGVPAWAVLRALYKRQSRLSRLQVQARQWFTADITERLSALYPIKAAGEIEPALSSGLRRQEEITSVEVDIGYTQGFISAFNPVLMAVMVGGYYLWTLRSGHAPDQVAAFGGVGLLGLRAVGQLNNVVASVGNLTRLAGSLPAVWAIAEIPREKPRLPLPEPLAEIRLEGVGYRFGGKQVLAGITLSARAGRLHLITGPSGAGKTTLANLACGLYEPTAGAVSYRGSKGGAYDALFYRPRLGFVTQDVHLLTGTVRENLDPWGGLGEEALWASLEQAGAAAFVRARGGLASPVAEGGRSLSGGERRRLAIARALAQRAECLILDEITNGLDAQTKGALIRTISALAGEVIILAITHDLPAFAGVEHELIPVPGASSLPSKDPA